MIEEIYKDIWGSYHEGHTLVNEVIHQVFFRLNLLYDTLKLNQRCKFAKTHELSPLTIIKIMIGPINPSKMEN